MTEKTKAPSDWLESNGAAKFEAHKNTNFIQKLKADIQAKSKQMEESETNFPTDGLPQVLLDFGMEISEVYGVPIEFPVLSALCAISATIRKKFVMDSGKYKNFGQLWLMFVAPPGVGKTEPVSAAFRPLQKLDNLSYEAYQAELCNWKNACTYAKQYKTQEPEKPFFKQALMDDFTPESLYQTMFRNHGAVTLYRDELSGWFADFGRYNKNGEISRYLSIFNNAQFCINRKSEEPLQIPEPFMSICVTIQPEILNLALNENNLKENGFASRFLYVYPKEIKKQKYSEKIPCDKITDQYDQLIKHCYQLPSAERPYTLSPEAKRLFVEYANQTTDMVNNCSNGFLRATYAKMEIQLLRIALIIQIVRGVQNAAEAQQHTISKEAIIYATALCNYFKSNVRRIDTADHAPQILPIDAIKIIQKEYGIKNKQAFAESIGVSRQYISKICNE